jgi:hypothetical protein
MFSGLREAIQVIASLYPEALSGHEICKIIAFLLVRVRSSSVALSN